MSEERKNCWEYMKCGREPGGKNADELGVCPVCKAVIHDGTNKGKNAGRFCWAVAGTLCEGKKQGTFASKFMSCLNCPFYRMVQREEGRDLTLTPPELDKTTDPDKHTES